jgi:hypothetical protein
MSLLQQPHLLQIHLHPLQPQPPWTPFHLLQNGILGDPFQPTNPNTLVSITFPPASNPPNNPFQPNATFVDPFAHVSIVKPIFDPFSLGVQANNVSFSTIGVLDSDLATTNAFLSGYPNIFVLSTTNGSTQWAQY